MSNRRRPRRPADLKGIGAAVAEVAPAIVFMSGRGRGGSTAVIVDTAKGRAMFVIAVPPAGSSPATLAAFSARATATVQGRCPECGAAAGWGRGPGGPSATVRHEHNCPATDEALAELVDADARAARDPGDT